MDKGNTVFGLAMIHGRAMIHVNYPSGKCVTHQSYPDLDDFGIGILLRSGFSDLLLASILQLASILFSLHVFPIYFFSAYSLSRHYPQPSIYDNAPASLSSTSKTFTSPHVRLVSIVSFIVVYYLRCLHH